MLIIFWPLVFVITLVLYGLMLISLPFDPVTATVFLFAIVAFWSRIPGVGMVSPFYIVYLMDFVDFFSLIIAINIGGVQGALFAFFLNMGSRAVGMFPSWMGVLKDSIAQSTVCLVIPFVHAATGGDIFVSMIWYSVLRWLMFFPLRILPTNMAFGPWLFTMTGAGVAALIINGIYARLLGGYFDGLLQSGVQFNFILFLFVTVIIGIVIATNYRGKVAERFPPLSRAGSAIIASIKKSFRDTKPGMKIHKPVQQIKQTEREYRKYRPHVSPDGRFRAPPKRKL